MKLKYKIKTIALLLICNVCLSQEIIIAENPIKDLEYVSGGTGPNKKKFNYSDLNFGATTNIVNTTSLPVQFGHYLSFQRITKRKLNELLAINIGLGINNYHYYLNESFKDQMPNISSEANKIKYRFFNFEGLFGMQIHFDLKRGNQMGKYLSLNGYGEWLPLNKLSYKLSNTTDAESTKIVHKRLNYIEPLQYGFIAKLMIKKIGIFAKYRFSSIFNNSLNELPRLTLGFNSTIYFTKYG